MSSHAEGKHGEGPHGEGPHAAGHHRNYVKIWAILLVLLVISVFGPFLQIRVITLLTAFGVAVVKAYMVAKNFMHLDVEKRIVQWTLAVAVVLMVMLFAGVSPDVMEDGGRGWKKDAGFHPVESVGHGAAGHGDAGHDAAEHETEAAGHGAAPDSAGPAGGAVHAPEDSASDGH